MDSIVNFLITTCRAVMFHKHLLPYEDNKDKFSTISKRPRRGFEEALTEIVENPKIKWGMRGQEFKEKDDDEQKDRDEKSVDEVISR